MRLLHKLFNQHRSYDTFHGREYHPIGRIVQDTLHNRWFYGYRVLHSFECWKCKKQFLELTD